MAMEIETTTVTQGDIRESVESTENTVKLPKSTKGLRFYYRHREEVLEQRRKKKLDDPEYQAKLKAREDAKKAKEEARREKEERKKAKEEERKKKEMERKEKRKARAKLVGVEISSGSN
jgi:membrane protein involved in colicin uptake